MASRDHPRVGGEKIKPLQRDATDGGSPPRGRGKDSFIVHRHACVGITPAWAGKSTRQGVPVEKRQGSPPRGRGKVIECKLLSAYTGITPAWAGKRRRSPKRRLPTGDHPRVGGEK